MLGAMEGSNKQDNKKPRDKYHGLVLTRAWLQNLADCNAAQSCHVRT